MSKEKLADYLFKRIQKAGVDCTFGIPGDFVLPIYAVQERLGIKTAVMTHEPSVGFAADGYARLKGLGVALVTYGAGGLNMVNPIGLAYAEESPVLVVSGSPETRYRQQKPQLHHCVKTFETQFNVFVQVTEAQALLTNPALAQEEIDRVMNAVTRRSRPGYIEIPRDMVNYEIEIVDLPQSTECQPPALIDAVDEILDKLCHAKQPVLFTGVELRRFALIDKVVGFAECLGLPVVTSILGKSSFPETHPNFVGTYFGQFGDPNVKQYVESADLIVCLGAVLTEMETGGYSAKLEPSRLIQVNASEVVIGHHVYNGLDLKALVDELATRGSEQPLTARQLPKIEPETLSLPANRDDLTVLAMIEDLNKILTEQFIVVSDVGDCLYAGLSLCTNTFIAPGYYSSMGFGVPAGIGVQLADPKRRPIILVGDGGFQMTGMEIATAVKLGLNPIVIVFDNASYAMLRYVDQKRDYYNLPRWDYKALAQAVGADGAYATTRAQFREALIQAQASKGVYLIDAKIAADDISPTLKRLTDHFGKKVKAAIS